MAAGGGWRLQALGVGSDHPLADAPAQGAVDADQLAQLLEALQLPRIHLLVEHQVAQVELALQVLQVALEPGVESTQGLVADGPRPGLVEACQHITLARVPEQLPAVFQAALKHPGSDDPRLFGFHRTGERGLPGKHAPGDHRHHRGDQQGADDGHATLLRRTGRMGFHDRPYSCQEPISAFTPSPSGWPSAPRENTSTSPLAPGLR